MYIYIHTAHDRGGHIHMYTYLYTYVYLYILPHHVLCVMHREPGSGGSWVPADTTEDTGHDFSKFPSPP